MLATHNAEVGTTPSHYALALRLFAFVHVLDGEASCQNLVLAFLWRIKATHKRRLHVPLSSGEIQSKPSG